jgi:two-component system, chemotaxis family, sensor kinase CheA
MRNGTGPEAPLAHDDDSAAGELLDCRASLNDIVAQLLTAEPGDNGRVARIRELLVPLAVAPSGQAWPAHAVTAAIELLDGLLGGGLEHENAVPRVCALLALALREDDEAAAAAAGGSGSAAPCVLPLDTARDLLPEFVAESLEYLQAAEEALLALEAEPLNVDALNVVLRAFHTIKSGAAFLGLDPLNTLAHSAESLLCHLRDNRVAFTGTHAQLTLQCADVMRGLVEQAPAALDGAALVLPAAVAGLQQRLREAEHAAAGEGGAEHAASTAGPAERAPGAGQPAAGVPLQQRAGHGDDAWIRLRTARLDSLVELIGELVVAQSMITQDPLVEQGRHGALGRKVSHAGKLVRELQQLGMSLRMVPLRPLFHRMQRVVRDAARASGKRVELVTEGGDTEIDRNMADLLTDPLVHMVRNAVDHGLELPAERAAAGKDPVGTVRLAAYHAGGFVVIELQDDGRGLDGERIVESAVAKRLVEPERDLTEDEISRLILAPGLSTAAEVTALSGRGVGMDVVRRNIEALRGRIEIDPRPGLGACFTLRLPLTLAVTDGMLVRVGAERYILRTSQIRTSFRPTGDELVAVAGGGELVTLHGEVLPVVRLHELFGVPDAVTDAARGLLVVVEDAGRRYALLVDELLRQQQFVAKPVGEGLGPVPGVGGAAILGDGRAGLIIDTADLISHWST